MAKSKCNAKQKNIEYPAVDIMRLILAIIIMTSHCFIFGSSKLFGLSGLLYNRYLARVAVPFFFICSGFFLARKPDLESSLKSNGLKFARLYLIWSLIYLPIGIDNIITSNNKVDAVKNMVIQFIQGNYPLWWLEGTAIACLCFLIFYVAGRKKIVVPFIVSLGFYIWGSFFCYCYLLKKNIPGFFAPFKILLSFFADPLACVRNGFIFGFLFVTIGIVINQKELYKKLSLKQWWVVFTVSMFMGCIEKIVFYKLGGVEAWATNTELFLIAAAPSLFCLTITLSNSWIEVSRYEPNTKRIRELSGIIFYTHYFIYYFVRKGLPFFLSTKSNFFNLLLGIMVSIITIYLAEVFLNKRNKWEFLNKLM